MNAKDPQINKAAKASLESGKNASPANNAGDIANLLSDIENSLKIKQALTQNASNTSNTSSDTSTSGLSINNTLTQTAAALGSINIIRQQLCRLPLDLCEKEYFDNNVFPLLETLNFLSNTSDNLSNSINILSTTPIVCRKKSKLKDYIHLLYDINDECEDVFDVLKKRIDILLECKEP